MAQNIDWKLESLPAEVDYNRPDPAKYDLTEELSAALRVAVALGQPLLITGKAGTGKTQLAHKAAAEFHKQDQRFLPEPIEFHTKSTSVARDLLYTYDAVRHFHDAGVRREVGQSAPAPEDYVSLNALGLAIVQSHPDAGRGVFQGKLLDAAARSSVVLIDEIDKAPRDFPNDLLHEINRFQFRVHEVPGSAPISRNTQQRIVVIITSNSDKNLPEAFLRRCVYCHIAEPDAERFRQILSIHFAGKFDGSKAAMDFLIEHFIRIRSAVTGKAPATAELINWFRILELDGLIPHIQRAGKFVALSEPHRQQLRRSLSVLVKTSEDIDAALQVIDPGHKASGK